MRDHELELIAALVEGRLEDETAARALIESAPEYREEYEAQKLAYESLRGMGSAVMSEAERAGLHREVWTELRGAPVATTGRPWYYRWVPVAAGLFVVVGVTAVLSQTGGDSTERLATDLAAAGTTSTAAATAPVDETEGAAGGGETLAEDGQQTVTTAAAQEGAGEEPDSNGTAAVFSQEAARVRQGELSGSDLETFDPDQTSSTELEECLTRLDLGDYQVVATLASPFDETTDTTEPAIAERLLVAVAEDFDAAKVPVAFISLDGCELVFLDE